VNARKAKEDLHIRVFQT